MDVASLKLGGFQQSGLIELFVQPILQLRALPPSSDQLARR